jgi:hypothetical protein
VNVVNIPRFARGSPRGAPECALAGVPGHTGGRRSGDGCTRNEHLLALRVATFLVMAGQGVVSPVVPLFAKDLGVSTTMVGLTPVHSSGHNRTASVCVRVRSGSLPAHHTTKRQGRRVRCEPVDL